MMQVNNCDVRFQLNTGADINTINQRFVRKEQVRKTNEKLVMWNCTKITPKSIVRLPTMNLKTGNTEDVDFVVVENGLTCLIGSATTQAMGLMTVSYQPSKPKQRPRPFRHSHAENRPQCPAKDSAM